MEGARETVELVARSAYGRLVAFLSSRTRDVAAAEDALSEALLEALTTWPRDGLPDKPEAWLLTAARHRLLDEQRRARTWERHEAELRTLIEDAAAPEIADGFPDERLKLFFVCAHPAIEAGVHAPLMLQAVLGLDAARIATVFLVTPAAMSQRLVRAKTKIREAAIPFEVPGDHELPQRLDSVLEAIYAAYGVGWDGVLGADPSDRELAQEAVWLARVLAQRLPDEPEVRGLLALLQFSESRRPARRTAGGEYVPLSRQDPALWSEDAIRAAEAELASAARLGRHRGRFQLEAAIQSVHADRRRTGRTDWEAVALFYEHLVRLAPALGARIAHAVAVSEVRGPAAGLALLDDIGPASVASHQPYWATRAHLLKRAGRKDEAVQAFDVAIALSREEAVRRFLQHSRDQA
jgi:RNA polymerase sigma-70 factor (ECF subfamily)